ncbi:N-acetylglucosamine-6-phosphate deacetylase [Romboutsia sp.]|uniref:N-acetylglucosamine-6-phosphate deacetylase n=1 Tax=Romboutsia sp. TaxID=1965302 RepID=UPI003F2B9A90
MKAIINGKIVQENSILENKVLLFDEKIVDICDVAPKDCELIDANGKYVSPGLIDIHVHGSNGSDTMDDNDDAIPNISKSLCKNGVTSYLPTTMTMDTVDIYKAFDRISLAMKSSIGGARVLGAHMEGPFINVKYKGAQNSNFIIKPSYNFVKDYIDSIKIISYAPEMDDDFSFTEEIKEKSDTTLSICHTQCTYELGKKYVEKGVSNITHLFNAMTPLNHREPGIVGLALMTDVYCELIADKIHVNKELFQFVLKTKGKDKVILITDCMRAGCMKDGEYDLGGQKVIVKDNAARLESGSLAGSVLTLNKAVYNFFENTDLGINEAIQLASLNPAKSISVDNRKGSLEIGKDADIAIFDEDMNCHLTIVEGQIVYNKIN